MSSGPVRRWTAWRFVDGKPGHDNQSQGLVEALGDLVDLDSRVIPVSDLKINALDLLRGHCCIESAAPTPDLLIGAGHATHLPMLACRRAHGGRIVVLMRPSLPMRWFDLCLIPEHDGVISSPHVLTTRGALNTVRPSGDRTAQGLILVGGPSRLYGWDTAQLVEQVGTIVKRDRRPWLLTTSRRTPDGVFEALAAAVGDVVEIIPWDRTPAGWLSDRLAHATAAWITEDSVSMLYEALTGGLACGILPVARRRGSGRVSRGIDRLVEEAMVVTFDHWLRGRPLQAADTPLAEARRCARWIRDRWLVA
jgi:mitochondrial fission protein ELM1